VWPSPADALKPVAHSRYPVERVAYAAEVLLRGVLAYQGAVRVRISASITRPEVAATRPGHRFGLIGYALAPLNDTLATTNPDALAQLKRDLAVIVSAEALFILTDLCRVHEDVVLVRAGGRELRDHGAPFAGLEPVPGVRWDAVLLAGRQRDLVPRSIEGIGWALFEGLAYDAGGHL
jgi:uncharacterized protein (DUF58 family)